MTIAGLTVLPRRELAYLCVLYALIVVCVLAIPAIAVHRREAPSHPTQHEQPRHEPARGR